MARRRPRRCSASGTLGHQRAHAPRRDQRRMTAIHQELADLGRALGAARWTQGPGGNVSVKDGDDLYVKASGRRLSDVVSAHVKVSRSTVERALDGDVEAAAMLFAADQL